jgi:hypothetical protein
MLRNFIFALLPFVPGEVLAASFDCSAATHISDVAICNHEDLSWREEAYVLDYQTAISRGGSVAAEAKKIASRQMTDRRKCKVDQTCIRDVINVASTALGVLNATYWDSPETEELVTSESGRWKQLDPLYIHELESIWHRLNGSCRGGSTLIHIEDCATREEVGEYLTRVRGWCYGRNGEAGVDFKWHECGPESLGAP